MSIRVTCPFCKAAFKSEDFFAGKQTNCPQCGGPVHVPLSDEEGPDQSESEEEVPVAEFVDDALAEDGANSNEDRKPCPLCGEMIMNDAVKCRYCGEIFDPLLKKQAKVVLRNDSSKPPMMLAQR